MIPYDQATTGTSMTVVTVYWTNTNGPTQVLESFGGFQPSPYQNQTQHYAHRRSEGSRFHHTEYRDHREELQQLKKALKRHRPPPLPRVFLSPEPQVRERAKQHTQERPGFRAAPRRPCYRGSR